MLCVQEIPLGDQAALDKRQAKYNKKSGPYPVFLNGDPNYILVDAQMGSAWYIITETGKQYDVTKKNIMCNVVSAGDADKGNVSASKPIRYLFYFNEKDKMAGVLANNMGLDHLSMMDHAL